MRRRKIEKDLLCIYELKLFNEKNYDLFSTIALHHVKDKISQILSKNWY